MVVHKRFLTVAWSLSLSLLLATVSGLWAADMSFSWQAPSTNEDGTPLVDLDHYKVHYGPVSRGSQTNPAAFQYQSSLTIAASQTSYTLTGLTPGQIYYVTVTAINTSGKESAYSNEISIMVPAPPPPVADFTALPTSGPAPLRVAFTDQSTGSIRSWSWDFGDGGSSAEQNPEYTFTTAGSYTVSLTVSGRDGISDPVTHTMTVNLPPEAPSGGSSTTLVEANFDSGPGDFRYVDDTFRGTSQASYASGTASDGALEVTLGGVNGADILGMSGGWRTSFSVSGAGVVTVSFRYNLTQSPGYERDECSEVLVQVGSQQLGNDGQDYVARLCGNGNGGAAETTGWQLFRTTLSLAPGTYDLTLGGYNTKKTYSDEYTTIRFDDVTMVIDGTTPAPVQIEPVQMWLEAESGQLTLPMVRGDDVAAFGESYVWVPQDPQIDACHIGTAAYITTVTTADVDTFVIWARVAPRFDHAGAFDLYVDTGFDFPWNIPLTIDGSTANTEAVSLTSPPTYQVTTLHCGEVYYIDRSYTVTGLPAALDGLVAIKTANDDKRQVSADFLSMTLSEDAMLYVAYDSRATALPDWLTANYTQTDMTIHTTDVPLIVWERLGSAGTVTIPGNLHGNPTGVGSNYIVLLEPQRGGGGPTWGWYQAQATTPVVVLDPGEHTLTVTVEHRWAGTKLDRLLITNDLDFTPAE